MAADVADAVASTGGWLFDRAIAGWQVTVLVATPDARALRILGAEIRGLYDIPDTSRRPHNRRPHTLALSAALCARDPRAHAYMTTALHDQGADVLWWGDGAAPAWSRRSAPVVHRFSVAARAFKYAALTAAGLPDLSSVPTRPSGPAIPTSPPAGPASIPQTEVSGRSTS
ncbi:hypothetical protein [Nocardia blacklockiae]|uniref:hypothetical protein n=1 Tax=Nocardia blacklockiae TaxID=480036 RepID=UPI0018947C3F|nr:hypothetical protein [Nocardia blacklockiae]MBF6171041.1 hypothetical protein [Nocardia blacklockiae]